MLIIAPGQELNRNISLSFSIIIIIIIIIMTLFHEDNILSYYALI